MDIIGDLKGLSNTNLANNTNIHPSKHREVNDAIIDALTPVNYGSVSDITQDLSGGEANGNISSFTFTSGTDFFKILCNLENEMPNTNYIVKTFLESNTAFLSSDSCLGTPTFKVISTTQFEVGFPELFFSISRNITAHFEVISRPY